MEVLIDLVRVTDVLLTTTAHGAATAWASTTKIFLPYKPDHAHPVAMSGYGYSGPDQLRLSWGPILEAHSGMSLGERL